MWPEMVRPAGFEPAAFGSGDLCAIQVGYFFCSPPERRPVTPVITTGRSGIVVHVRL